MAHNPFLDLAKISTPDYCTDLYQNWHHLARLRMPDNAGLIMIYARLKLGQQTGAERSTVFFFIYGLAAHNLARPVRCATINKKCASLSLSVDRA